MFFDNASTTKIDLDIFDALVKDNDQKFYNPGALYSFGRDVKKELELSRQKILRNLGATSGKLIFTGSATEANNLALFGTLKKNTRKILVSQGEHPSVYNSALEMKSRGYNVQFVPLTRDGTVDVSAFEDLMDEQVDFVSIMHVSNETGAVNDIVKLVEIAKNINPKVVFHCDGVQALGKIKVDVDALGVDMYTISAHKIYGMKGVGALYVANNIRLKPIIYGGEQEEGLRSGTENVLGIKLFSAVVESAVRNQKVNYEKVTELKNRLLELLENSGIEYILNSYATNSPYVLSISFKNCRAETLLYMLDDMGIMVGNGSACSSKKSGNRILEAMGRTNKEIEGNLRISFSKYNTREEIDVLAEKLVLCVKNYLKNTNR